MSKKTILSLILVVIFTISNIPVFAASSSAQDITITSDIVNKASKGDSKAIEALNTYFNNLIEKAKGGDKASISKLKNLDCFNPNKVKEKLSSYDSKVKLGQTIKVYFDDGSYTIVSSSPASSQSKTTNATANDNTIISPLAANWFSVTQTWGFGVCQMSLTCNINNEGSTRYRCHISSVYPSYLSIGCTMSGVEAGIDINDTQPAYCHASAEATAFLIPASWSLYMYVGVDCMGFGWVEFKNP